MSGYFDSTNFAKIYIEALSAIILGKTKWNFSGKITFSVTPLSPEMWAKITKEVKRIFLLKGIKVKFAGSIVELSEVQK